MKKATLLIETNGETKSVTLDEEISIGRTDAADIVFGDVGLSRKNTSFFRDGEVIFVVDENSLNGTFVNGEKVSDQPQRVFDGDEIKIGTETYIRVEIASDSKSKVQSPKSITNSSQQGKRQIQNPKPKIQNRTSLHL